MQRKSGLIRNKLMLGCALVAAAVLATPAAMAHDYYRGHGDDSGKVLGALVVGAVIGGVIASASEHHDRYDDGGYYYPAQGYPAPGYYESYPAYPAYSYEDTGYYNYPAYPGYGSVNVGVVYSGRSGHGYYGGSRGYYGHGGYDGGSRGYRGYHSHDGRYDGGGQGHYYSRHGH